MTRLQRELEARGEERHETCRFGRLTEAWLVEHGAETALSIPVCDWEPAKPHPPAIRRAWGGDVQYARDCAICDAHREVDDGLPISTTRKAG